MGSLAGKEIEIIDEMKNYRLDILELSDVKKKGAGEIRMERGHTLVYSRAPPGNRAVEGVGIIMTDELF